MTLNDAQLLSIIEKRPNKALIEFGRQQLKRARLHLYGVGMAEHLTQIEGFEKPFVHEVRAKYAVSNRDLFSRVLKPTEKVFTARGTSSYYNLGPEGNGVAAMLEMNVRNGYSCKKWIETHWKTHAIDDPMGMVFMEVDANMNCYPTYKSITSVYEYQLDGFGFEFIIFNVSNAEKLAMGLEKEAQVFRVVDDAGDDIVVIKTENNQKRVWRVPEHSYTNWFYDVPAVVNGFVPNPDGDGFVSFLHDAWELADQYLLENSIKLTHKFMHGFPKYYEFADDCLMCAASGKVNAKKCTNCKGTGKKLMTKVSDTKYLEYPTKDTPKIDVPGGYIEPSKVFWEMVRGEMAELEQKINQTIWGSKPTNKLQKGMGLSAAPNGTATATEVMDNRQPEYDNLHKISDAAEYRDKFVMDCRITINMNQPQYIRKGGCSKNYGRRYLIEEPDALLDRYVASRKEGVSPSILYGMYEQYLEAKYATDGVSLSLHKKLMKVEPFMHYTLAEMKLNGATPEDIRRKQWYGEWLASMDGDTLIVSATQALIKSFDAFCATKPLPVEEKEEKPKPVKS